MTMKRYRIFLAILVAIMSAAFSNAQDIEQLWATGSAVPDGICQQTGQFCVAGNLVSFHNDLLSCLKNSLIIIFLTEHPDQKKYSDLYW